VPLSPDLSPTETFFTLAFRTFSVCLWSLPVEAPSLAMQRIWAIGLVAKPKRGMIGLGMVWLLGHQGNRERTGTLPRRHGREQLVNDNNKNLA